MKTINTTDIWTEPYKNYDDCTCGAFIDGIENDYYDSYKVVLNCNCVISAPKEIVVGNKHNAVIFYKNGEVARLLLLTNETNVEKSINKALNQEINGEKLKTLLLKRGVKREKVDLKEKPIFNENNNKKEMDICSCDREPLLRAMLGGGYTESETVLGNHECNNYEFMPQIKINYYLKTDYEIFDIKHKGVFLNKTKTQAIILQASSSFLIEDVESML